MDPYTTAAIREDYERKCARAGLDAEQTAQVIAYRLDPWACNSDGPANEVIDFMRWQNEGCGPLCPECGDPRDTNILAVRR